MREENKENNNDSVPLSTRSINGVPSRAQQPLLPPAATSTTYTPSYAPSQPQPQPQPQPYVSSQPPSARSDALLSSLPHTLRSMGARDPLRPSQLPPLQQPQPATHIPPLRIADILAMQHPAPYNRQSSLQQQSPSSLAKFPHNAPLPPEQDARLREIVRKMRLNSTKPSFPSFSSTGAVPPPPSLGAALESQPHQVPLEFESDITEDVDELDELGLNSRKSLETLLEINREDVSTAPIPRKQGSEHEGAMDFRTNTPTLSATANITAIHMHHAGGGGGGGGGATAATNNMAAAAATAAATNNKNNITNVMVHQQRHVVSGDIYIESKTSGEFVRLRRDEQVQEEAAENERRKQRELQAQYSSTISQHHHIAEFAQNELEIDGLISHVNVIQSCLNSFWLLVGGLLVGACLLQVYLIYLKSSDRQFLSYYSVVSSACRKLIYVLCGFCACLSLWRLSLEHGQAEPQADSQSRSGAQGLALGQAEGEQNAAFQSRYVDANRGKGLIARNVACSFFYFLAFLITLIMVPLDDYMSIRYDADPSWFAPTTSPALPSTLTSRIDSWYREAVVRLICVSVGWLGLVHRFGWSEHQLFTIKQLQIKHEKLQKIKQQNNEIAHLGAGASAHLHEPDAFFASRTLNQRPATSANLNQAQATWGTSTAAQRRTANNSTEGQIMQIPQRNAN